MVKLALLGGGAIFNAVIERYLADPCLKDILPIRLLVTAEAVAERLPQIATTDARHPAAEAIAEALQREEIAYLFSIQYGWILPGFVLEAVKGQALNLHNAKLPEYRGHHALTHEILNGETEHVVSVHWMQPRVDTGFLALERRIPIAGDETAWSLGQKAIPAAVDAAMEVLHALGNGRSLPKIPIPNGGRFFSRREADALKRIRDPSDVDEIDRKSRAFHYPPYEPAYVEVSGRRHYLTPAAPYYEALKI